MPSQTVLDNIAKLRAELPETVGAIEAAAAGKIGRRTLADAILAISIGELDWHAGQIVKGENESALALAGLIGDEYDRLMGPQVSELSLFLNALATTAKLDDETRAAFLRKMGR